MGSLFDHIIFVATANRVGSKKNDDENLDYFIVLYLQTKKNEVKWKKRRNNKSKIMAMAKKPSIL